MNDKKALYYLLLAVTILRILIAGTLELGNDEVYYLTYAQRLQWNYFDHPPMIALLIRLTTLNGLLPGDFFIRLGPILLSIVNTILVFNIGKSIGNSASGFISACLFSFSFFSSIIAGTFILPDTPQMFFWLISCWLIVDILRFQRPGIFWIYLGVAIGCCIMSKIHGIFLWVGIGGFVLFNRRDLLKNPYLYIGMLVTLVMISPIYFWNLNNHFITYQYHSGRFGFLDRKPDWDALLQQIFGSIFYNNPVNVGIFVLLGVVAVRTRAQKRSPWFWLFLWMGLPLILILLFVSLFNETLPHWSGPAYTGFMFLAGVFLEKRSLVRVPKFIRWSGVLFAVVVVIGILSIRFLPFSLGSRHADELGAGDVTLDMSGWKDFSKRFDQLYREDIRSGSMQPGAVILSEHWFPAAHLEHYVAKPAHMSLLAVGSLHNIHHFAWTDILKPPVTEGSDAYFIYPTNYNKPPDEALRLCFSGRSDSLQLPQYRSGVHVRDFVIIRLHGLLKARLEALIPVTH